MSAAKPWPNSPAKVGVAATPRGRRGIVLALVTGAVLALSSVAYGQTQSQVHFTYDAAGNLVGATRPSGPAPDLTLSNLTIDLIVKNGDGSFSITATYTVTNAGTAGAMPTWYDRAYLSTDATHQDSDPILGGANTRSASLAPGASYSATTVFTTSTTTAPGTYTLIVKADGGAGTGQFAPTGPSAVAELNDYNNSASASVVLPANPKADLIVTDLAVGTIAENQNGSYSIPVTFQVRNVGNLGTSGTWYDRGYLSANPTLEDTDPLLTNYNTHGTALAPGDSYPAAITLTTPTTTAAGAYTLIVKADGGSQASGQYAPTGPNVVAELNESNNTQALPLVLPVKPDLTASNLVVGTIAANQNGTFGIPVSFQVNNVGGSPALPSWADRGYLSTDPALQDTDLILTGYHTRSTALAPGASYAVALTLVAPASTGPGSYTLIVKADGGATSGQYAPTGPAVVREQDDTNNTQTAAIVLPGRADLTVSNLAVGTITPRAGGGYNIPVTFEVNNTGGSPAIASWADRGYLSVDSTHGDADPILGGYHNRTTNLAAGASYSVSLTFTTSSATTAGSYTLFVKADGGATSGQYAPTGPAVVIEANESNNTAATAVTLP